jgi:hypothetical protein
MRKADAIIPEQSTPNTQQIINNLEVLENFIKLYFDNATKLAEEFSIEQSGKFTSVFCNIIKIIERKMGLTKRVSKNKVLLDPENAPLDCVLAVCEDENVQWELIRYSRENMSLAEKGKTLAYLATNLNIEQDKSEDDDTIKEITSKTTDILNNLQIRHNNKTGKWLNPILNDMDEKDIIALYDRAFNQMLVIILLRECKKSDEVYKSYKAKQKQHKEK